MAGEAGSHPEQGGIPGPGRTEPPTSYVPGPAPQSGPPRTSKLLRPWLKAPGAITALLAAILFALFSLATFTKASVPRTDVKGACRGVQGTSLYGRCVREMEGRQLDLSSVSWNAWHRFTTWVPVLLLLVAACVYGAKLLGYQPRKRRLESTALILVIISDILFFWAFSNTKDGEVHAWGIYIAMILLILINIGALLAFVNIDGLVAARAREREKQTNGGDPFDKGQYPVGQSPRYDTPAPPPGYVPPPTQPGSGRYVPPRQPPTDGGYVPPPQG